jgi:hypothetical protein
MANSKTSNSAAATIHYTHHERPGAVTRRPHRQAVRVLAAVRGRTAAPPDRVPPTPRWNPDRPQRRGCTTGPKDPPSRGLRSGTKGPDADTGRHAQSRRRRRHDRGARRVSYVVAGELLAWRRPRATWPHLPRVDGGLTIAVFHLDYRPRGFDSSALEFRRSVLCVPRSAGCMRGRCPEDVINHV